MCLLALGPRVARMTIFTAPSVARLDFIWNNRLSYSCYFSFILLLCTEGSFLTKFFRSAAIWLEYSHSRVEVGEKQLQLGIHEGSCLVQAEFPWPNQSLQLWRCWLTRLRSIQRKWPLGWLVAQFQRCQLWGIQYLQHFHQDCVKFQAALKK